MLKRIYGLLMGGFIFMMATIVVAGDIDTKGPEFVSITISPETVNVGIADGRPKFRIHATDDLSGVGTIQIMLASENSKRGGTVRMFGYDHLVSGNLQDGIWENILLIPKFSAPDEWFVWQILLHDMVGNETKIAAEDLPNSDTRLIITNTVETQFIPLVVNP